MSDSAVVELPKGLKHWINSVKTTSCTLFNTLEDLRDGHCIRELVEHIFHCKIAVEERTPAGLIQGSLNTVAEQIGWKNIPPEFKTPQAAFRLSQKGEEKVFMCAFIQFLHDLALQSGEHTQSTSSLDAEVAETMNEVRSNIQHEAQQATAVHAERSQLYPDYLDEQPLSYEDYLHFADFDKDSLQSDEELNVMKSADFRNRKLHSTVKNGRKVTSKPTLSRSGSNTGGVLILKQKISSAPLRPSTKLANVSTQAQKPAPATSPVPLVSRRVTKPKLNTTNNNTSTTGHTTSNKPLATPANVKIHDSGLHMSTLHDPTYKPKKSNLFTQTIVPEEVVLSESSESEDSIQPNYDRTARNSRNGSIDNASNSRNRRIPYSRSISPVGRRHIHCTLNSLQNTTHGHTHNHAHSTTSTGSHTNTSSHTRGAPFGVTSRSVSPLEARLSRYYPYQQPYDPAVITTQSSSDRPNVHNATTAAAPQYPHNPSVAIKPKNTVPENPIKTKQMQAVTGVFKRNDPQHRQPAVSNIDDVISTERKNAILLWIQKHLNITIDVFVSSATSNQYNKTAGKNLVNPDTVAVIPNKHNTANNTTSNANQGNATTNNVYSATHNTHAAFAVQNKANKENYTFYPHPEDAYFSAGRSAYMHGTYSIATYLGRVTNAVSEYSSAISERLLQQERILQIPEQFVDNVGFRVPPQVRTPHTPIGLLNDPWVNGMLLSEILASLSGENRALIKQVESYDRFGKLLSPPKLIVAGTEHNVRSKAQATHNVQLCMDFLSSTIPLFPVLDYCAQDVISGEVSLWALLNVVYELCKNKKVNSNNGTNGRSGSNGRGRSVSPGLRAKSSIRSISAPPPESRHTTHNTNNNNVSFAADSLGTHTHPNTRYNGATTNNNTVSHSGSTEHTSASATTNKATRTTHTTSKSRSRSTSPNSVHSAGTTTSNNNIDANAASMLEFRRQERENERLKAREYMQRKRQSGATNTSESNTTENSEKAEKGWVNSTAVEKPRSASVNTRRASVTTTTNTKTNTNSSNNATEGVSSSGQPNQTNSSSTAASATSVGSSKTQAHLSVPSKHWLPPKLSQTEIDAARNTYLPTITIFQMRTIRDWLRNAFDITLLDAECGFSYMGMLHNIHGGNNNTSDKVTMDGKDINSSTTPAASANGKTTSASRKADVRFEPRYEPTSVTTPAPLPLQSDRLRNGVVLGQLLMRLEPNAAIHAQIPRLLHKHPRSIDLCLENIERVMWVFKLRRSPPLPYHYLCLSEEILQGNEKVVWGLLWELMQAYPYAALQGGNKTHANAAATNNNSHMNPKTHPTMPSNFDNYQENTTNGVLNANPDILLPQPGNGPLKHPRNSTRASIKPTQNVFGLKGAEAKHNVPAYNRYNLSHPELENPVPLHTLPYSDVQRHLLDKSLLAWLEETNVLYSIVGSLGRPVTILALESYCRDGTLFCMLLTDVLKLDLSKEYLRQPSTYSECIGNIKLCTEVLRKCQTMRGRYLYGGVEEHICSGRWDSILGLLEDMHRYSDGVHPHAQLFSTVDSSGYVAGSGEASGIGAFDLNTIDVPYLGKYGISMGGSRDENAVDEDGRQEHANYNTTGTGNKAYPMRAMSNSQGPDLLHDVEYAFDPQLNLHPVDITPTIHNNNHVPVHTTPSLDQQMHPLPLHPTNNNTHGVQSGDLFPSNTVSGANVVNLLKQQNDKNNTTSTHNTHNHTSRIPHRTPQQNTTNGNFNTTANTSSNTNTPNAIPTWVVKDHSPVALSQALSLNDSDTDARTGYSSAEGGARRPATTRSARSVSPVPSRNSASSGASGSGNKQNTPVQLRSALKTPSTDSHSPTRRAAHATVGARRSTPFSSNHATNTSVYSSDSLDYPSSLEFTPERDLHNKAGLTEQYSKIGVNGMSASPERSPSSRIEPAKFRRLTKWLDKIGVNVPRRSERSFITKDIFADGVYLCLILQKLERSAPLPGTFPQPRVHSERVQNVRRCLEFLASRHKNIPLRALSCEDDVLEGDLVRTVELLFCIKKVYANHRL